MTLQDTESYADILDQVWDDLPEEVKIPAGPYRLRCTNAGSKAKDVENNKPARAWFVYSIVEAGRGHEDIAKFNAIPKIDVEGLEIMVSFNLKKKFDIDRLNKHILAHGVKPQKGQTRADLIKAVKSTEVMAFCRPDEYTNGQGELVETTRAEDFFAAE
jgi:hypothetical protein